MANQYRGHLPPAQEAGAGANLNEARDRLTRCGLLLNAAGGLLLLICHFPFALPSGDPPSITGDFAPWAEVWHWTNLVGSIAGALATVGGIILQYRAIAGRSVPEEIVPRDGE